MSRFLLMICASVIGVTGCNNTKFTLSPPPTEAEYSTGAFSVPYPSDLFITYAALNEASLAAGGAPGAQITNTPIIPSATDVTDTGDVLIAQGFLDGFSTTMPMQIDFTHNINPDSVLGGQTVRVFEVAISPPSDSFNTVGAPVALPVSIIRELQADSDYSATLTRSVQYQILVKPKIPWPASDNVSLGGLSRGIMVAVTNGVEDFRGNAVIRSDQFERMANGIVENTGNAATDGFANAMGAVVGQSLGLLAGQGMDPNQVVVVNSFTCQSVTDVLDGAVQATIAQAPAATTPGVAAAGLETVGDYLVAVGVISDPSALPYNALLYQGSITLPSYYPGDSSGPAGWTEAATGYWKNGGVVYQSSSPPAANPGHTTRYNPVPTVQGTMEVPVLVATPDPSVLSSAPPPWPVVIFQHGITRSRFDAAAFTSLLCGAGYAVISMDAPLHGTTAANPLVAGPAGPFLYPGEERTLGIDLLDNATGLPTGFDANGFAIGDGIPEESGQYFLNFPSLISSRSVWMQAVCDLALLTATIPDWDFNDNGDLSDDFTSEVHYVGQSLGGLIGTTFLSAMPEGYISSGELNVTGGGIAKMLENSPIYNPRLLNFFAGEGLVQGSTRAEQAMNVISAVADAVDPINHIRRAASRVPIHMGIVVGGKSTPDNAFGVWLPDTVVPTDSRGSGLYATLVGTPVTDIPNGAGDPGLYLGIAEPSYLGGSFPMARMASLPRPELSTNVTGIKNYPADLPSGGATHYIAGDHGSFADPTSDVGASMQFGERFWASSSGKQILLLNGGTIGGGLEPPILDLNPVEIPISSGETVLGSITINETGDANSPVEATFETFGHAGTLGAAAAALGGHHFNWYQVVTVDDQPALSSSDDVNVAGSDLVAPRIDPPSGGTGQTAPSALDGIYADAKPWLWNEVQTSPEGFSADQTTTGIFHCVREYTNNSAAPSPAGVDACVGNPNAQTHLSYEIGPWMQGLVNDGLNGDGERFQVRVWLVCVDANGDAVRLLNGFTYGQQVTGASALTTGTAEMPGSPGATNDDLLLLGF
ncbi:MAG: hypothetical protein AAEJ04_04365 [Planctomycetota bacterium]